MLCRSSNAINTSWRRQSGCADSLASLYGEIIEEWSKTKSKFCRCMDHDLRRLDDEPRNRGRPPPGLGPASRVHLPAALIIDQVGREDGEDCWCYCDLEFK